MKGKKTHLTRQYKGTTLEVFYYDGKPGTARGCAPDEYLVVMIDGTELPGWYTRFDDELVDGPFDSEAEAQAATITSFGFKSDGLGAVR